MNFRTRTLLAGLGKCVRMAAFAVLPALTTEAGSPTPAYHGPHDQASPCDSTDHGRKRSTPYLRSVATPALRIADGDPSPSYDLDATPTGPYIPDEGARQGSSANATRERPDIIPPAANKQVDSDAARPAKPSEEILPIIPDDLQREVRPEDIIPFFVMPQAGVRIGVGVQTAPQPPAQPMPQSSATYNLK